MSALDLVAELLQGLPNRARSPAVQSVRSSLFNRLGPLLVPDPVVQRAAAPPGRGQDVAGAPHTVHRERNHRKPGTDAPFATSRGLFVWGLLFFWLLFFWGLLCVFHVASSLRERKHGLAG